MSIFQKDDASETRREYKVTMVSGSLFTYLVVLVSMIAVNWGHIKRKYLKWQRKWHPASDNSTAEGSAESAPGAQGGPAPASPEPKPEEAGQAVKRRFPWFTRPRDSSRWQAKGKAPEQGPLNV
jgi:hypothetical protein